MSTFALKREYALQLPTSYVDIECEVLAYIEGGLDIISVRLAGAIINAALSVAVRGIGISGYIAAYGKGKAKLIFTKTVSSRLAAWGCRKLAIALSVAIEVSFNYLDIGTNIAKYIDRYDYKPNNGRLSI